MIHTVRPGFAGGGGGGASIVRAQVTGRLLAPFRLQAKKINSDGSLDTTVLEVNVDTFESPVDWDNVTPSIVIGTVVPIYSGMDLATATSVMWLLWPVTATAPCTA